MAVVQNNKQLMHSFYENVLNKRNWNRLEDFISPQFKNATGQKGTNAFIEPIRSFIDAFPDVQWKVQQIVTEEDIAMIWWRLEGTQTKPFMGYVNRSKKISIEGTGMLELKDGKIIGAQVLTDRLGLLQQINALPADLSLPNKQDERAINFIDKFFVPAVAVKSFEERMKINREFIKSLPGFNKDEVYRQFDEDGNLVCITIANWESTEALAKAKEAVQEEYKRQNFNPAKMFEELGITMDRGLYKKE